MKKINIIMVSMLVVAGLFTIQGCKKDSDPQPIVYQAAMPASPVPSDASVVTLTGTTANPQTITLTWAGIKSDGTSNPIKWKVYFGTKSNVTASMYNYTVTGKNSLDVTVTKGGTYYWQVYTIDANNISSTSSVWSVVVNSNPSVPSITPANNATSVAVNSSLQFPATDPEGNPLTYTVYLGTSENLAIAGTSTNGSFTPATPLAYSTKYYWKVTVTDPYGGTNTTPVNSFTTAAYVPDFTVLNGLASEVSPSVLASATHKVTILVNTATNMITLTNPLADDMVQAGWGSSYTGVHPIYLTYDPVSMVITGATKQLWLDSFPDPIEQGPMYLDVLTGSSINLTNKTLTIVWKVSGTTAEWGSPATLKASVYTHVSNK